MVWHITDEGTWQSQLCEQVQLDQLQLVRFGTGRDGGTALLADPGTLLRVNGQRIWGGLHVLQHKDEMQVGTDRYWYSAEMQPHVTQFEKGADTDTRKCPLCRVPIEAGDLVVCCPGCGRSYHQSDAKQCWTYREQCKFCGHPTALTGEPAWRPDMEEADV